MKRAMACAVMILAGCGVARAATPTRPPIVSVSHLAVYAADLAKSEAFYGHDLGGVKRPDPEDPRGARYYFSPVQFIEVLPLPPAPHRSTAWHTPPSTPPTPKPCGPIWRRAASRSRRGSPRGTTGAVGSTSSTPRARGCSSFSRRPRRPPSRPTRCPATSSTSASFMTPRARTPSIARSSASDPTGSAA